MATTRRDALTAILQLPTAAVLMFYAKTAVSTAASGKDADLEMLASIAYDILPFPELPRSLYTKAARQILALDDSSVAAGMTKLRDANHGIAWKDVPAGGRVAILASIQETPFFRLLRSNAVQVLLRDPATYVLVGYGGPSIPYGGYQFRGFNDINWLPKLASRVQKAHS